MNRRQLKKAIGVGLACALCCLIGVSAYADDEPGDSRMVRVAVMGYPNFIMMDDGGVVSGYAYEYLKDIQNYTGWEYEFLPMSLAEASAALASEEIDILPGTQYTAERAQNWDYSQRDMGEDATALCVMPDNNSYAYNDFASFDGMRVGAMKATTRIGQLREKFKEYGATPVIVEYETDSDAKAALRAGAVDAIVMSTIRCEAAYKVVAKLKSSPLYFCLNKQRPELKAGLDNAMDELHLRSPYYDEELDRKYYGDLITQSSLTSDEMRYVETAAPIVVAVSTDMPPIEYYDADDGEYCGIIPDILVLVSEYTGLSFKCVDRENQETLERQMDEGEIQLIASIASVDTLMTDMSITVSEPLLNDGISLITKRGGNDADIGGTMLLKSGYPLLDYMAGKNGYTTVEHTDSFEECLNAVNSGRAAFTLLPYNSVSRLVDHAYYADLAAYALPDSTFEFGFGVPNTADPRLLPILNKAVSSVSDEQRTKLLIENLKETGGSHVSLREFAAENQKELLLAALAAALLIMLAIIWNTWRIRRLNCKLRLEAARADQSSMAKSDFLSCMSHDMRTPLNAIIGFSSAELAESAPPEELISNCHNINLSAKYLLTLINDVLHLSKIERGQIEYSFQKVNTDSFLDEIEMIAHPVAAERKVAFTADRQGVNFAYLVFDKVHLEQILMNLLNNAIKFTPEGGSVQLRAETAGGGDDPISLRFTVSDTGIGIGKDFLPSLFEPFTREGLSDQPGTGLGLCIVKRLVDGLHGTIDVESVKGKGTTFTVVIPTGSCCQESEEPEAAVSEIYDLAGKRVLVCEDHPLNAQIAARLLEKQGILRMWPATERRG